MKPQMKLYFILLFIIGAIFYLLRKFWEKIRKMLIIDEKMSYFVTFLFSVQSKKAIYLGFTHNLENGKIGRAHDVIVQKIAQSI